MLNDINIMEEIIYTTCAVCQLSDGLVINKIVASPTDLPPDNCQLIEIDPGVDCDIGWYWDGSIFIEPINELAS